MDWMKISSAIFLGIMIVLLLPRAKAIMSNTPEAKPGDWNSAILPLLAVAGFIALLMAFAR